MARFHLAARRFHAADGLILIKEDLRGGAVHPYLAAHLPEAFEKAGRQLVARLIRDPCAVVDVQPEHVHVLQKGEVVHIHAEIAPVGPHDVLRELRHFHGAEHLVHRIAAETQEVGEVLLHVFRVGLSRDAERIVARLVELGAEIKKVLDRLAAAGDEPLHFVDKFLHGAGKRRIDVGLAVGGGGDHTEVVRYHVPRDIQPELLTRFAAAAGIFLAAPFADLVQRGLKLKASPAEAEAQPPGRLCRSTRSVFLPPFAIRQAAARPPLPAPMTTASYFCMVLSSLLIFALALSWYYHAISLIRIYTAPPARQALPGDFIGLQKSGD